MEAWPPGSFYLLSRRRLRGAVAELEHGAYIGMSSTPKRYVIDRLWTQRSLFRRRILNSRRISHAWTAGRSRCVGDRPVQALRLDRDGRPEARRRCGDGFRPRCPACALGQTSSSIMARQYDRRDRQTSFASFASADVAMLKDNGAPPTGKWDDLKYLEPVRDYKARHASTLLVFDAVVDALDQIEGRARTVACRITMRRVLVRQSPLHSGAFEAIATRSSGLRGPPVPAPADLLGIHATTRSGGTASGPAAGWASPASAAAGPAAPTASTRSRRRCPEARAWYKPWTYGRWRGVNAPEMPLRSPARQSNLTATELAFRSNKPSAPAYLLRWQE